MATTAQTMCVEALTIAGVVGDGQTPSGMIINATLARMNRMLSLWQRKRWLIWHLKENLYLSQGENSFSVGPGGNFNMPRPDRVEAAFFRQLVTAPNQAIDYPLEEIKSWEDWANVALKTLKSFPTYFFYDAGMPIATLYAWPVPQTTLYEVHLLTKEILAQFANLATAFLLPPEYEAAIIYSLARITRVAFRKPADAELNALARDALNTIRKANAQVARLTMPADLTRPGIYNIFSDQVR